MAAEARPQQYAAAFRENKIDDMVLPRLTAEDLKELVSDLWGIAVTFSSPSARCGPKPATAPPIRRVPRTDKAVKDTAERRQVTG